MPLETLTDKCGVIGISSDREKIGLDIREGLDSLQHRGQDAAGAATEKNNQIYSIRNLGLVAEAISEEDAKHLPGSKGIGHNRWKTDGDLGNDKTQPIIPPSEKVALAHNGNLVTKEPMKEVLLRRGRWHPDLNDSGYMGHTIDSFMHSGQTIDEAVALSMPYFIGAYSALALGQDKLVAFRDPLGIRPLSIGVRDDGYVVASETVALDRLKAKFLRDVNPGEMVVFDDKGMTSHQVLKGRRNLCVFEFIYLAHEDSIIGGKSVKEVRRNLGRKLASVYNPDVDGVVGIPNSGSRIAEGYAEARGLELVPGIRRVKNRRSFIMPDQVSREQMVRMKLEFDSKLLRGRRLLFADDSIVRGTTLPVVSYMALVENDVQEMHMGVGSSRVLYENVLGVATGPASGLIASNKTDEQIKIHANLDSLGYLPFNLMIEAIGLPEEELESAVFTGRYPSEIKNYIDLETRELQLV